VHRSLWRFPVGRYSLGCETWASAHTTTLPAILSETRPAIHPLPTHSPSTYRPSRQTVKNKSDWVGGSRAQPGQPSSQLVILPPSHSPTDPTGCIMPPCTFTDPPSHTHTPPPLTHVCQASALLGACNCASNWPASWTRSSTSIRTCTTTKYAPSASSAPSAFLCFPSLPSPSLRTSAQPHARTHARTHATQVHTKHNTHAYTTRTNTHQHISTSARTHTLVHQLAHTH